MRRLFLPALLSLMLLVGAGCTSQEAPTAPTPTVATSTPAQRAHALCLTTGNKPELRRVTDKLSPVLVCVFPDGSECPALSLLNETCVPTPPAAEPTAEEGGPVSGLPRFCDPVAEPVCGSDGKTYVNACVAEQQQVSVVQQGSCPPSEVVNRPPVGPTQGIPPTPSQPVPSAPPVTQPTPSGGVPKWLEVPIALLEENANAVRPFIQECSVGGQRYYFQGEDCVQCLSVLYTSDGQVVCYPSHDLNNQCPTQISNRSCKTIWQKK